MSRNVGVLNAPVSSGLFVTLNRPTIRLFLVHADADVVILLIRKQNSIVAVVTLDRLENIPPAPRALAQRR